MFPGIQFNILPTVTVAIPAYNEANDIERVIRCFLATSYPHVKEIFIADGGSTDGTQAIVQQLSQEDARVKLLHNQQKIQSAGLNLILSASTGDIFLRADAHSEYASDYIERCVQALLESEACNVGGAQRFVAKTPFQAGVALASKSFLGSGGAKYRNPDYNGYGDTVYLGCFWQNVLKQLSGYWIEATPNEDSELNLRLRNSVFDTSQITNQDAELNQRLIGKYTQAIYIDSRICAWYYPRQTWKSLFNQYFKYGRGRCLTSSKHRTRSQLRGKLPFLVLSVAFIFTLISLVIPAFRLPIVGLILLVLLISSLESLRVNLKFCDNFQTLFWRGNDDDLPSFLTRWFFCDVTLLTLPIAHFAGYSYQLFRLKVAKVNGW